MADEVSLLYSSAITRWNDDGKKGLNNNKTDGKQHNY